MVIEQPMSSITWLTPRFIVANRVPPFAIGLAFRIASAAILSRTGRYRFLFAGIGARQLAMTLRHIRGLHAWPSAWVRTAHHYLSAAAEHRRHGAWREAISCQRAAALCYHFAQLFVIDDILRRRALYREAARLFRAVAPLLTPPAEPIAVPWRGFNLPGYLRLPQQPSPRYQPFPLVVFLNGSSTAKEETVHWAQPFLARGIAVLALDTPGSGEAWDQLPAAPGQEDLADALLCFAEGHPALSADRVAVLGLSLRGAYAVQLGAHQPALAAVLAVTPPFLPRPYLKLLHPLVRHDVAFSLGIPPTMLEQLVDRLALSDIAPRLRQPLFVVGAGNDLVVPPAEAVRLYRAAGGPKRLLYLERANHVAFTHLEQWTTVAAEWLADRFALHL